MNLITKKEYAKLAGMPTKDLSNYIKREKVFCHGKLIDLDLPENILFLEHRQEQFPGLMSVERLPTQEFFERILEAFNKTIKLTMKNKKEFELTNPDETTKELFQKLNWVLSFSAKIANRRSVNR